MPEYSVLIRPDTTLLDYVALGYDALDASLRLLHRTSPLNYHDHTITQYSDTTPDKIKQRNAINP